MISDTIQKQINKAMKAKDEIRMTTLRLLSAALHNAEIEKKREKLTKEEEIAIVKKEVKKRKEAIELYEKGGAKDKADREKKESEILKKYLPEEMGDEELRKIVDESIKQSGAKSMADIGKVMGMAMGKAKGQADGNRVSALVKEKLSKND